MEILKTIASELATLLSEIRLRATLDRADAIGKLLLEARGQVPHGEWIPWLRERGLNRKTAHDYIMVHRGLASGNVRHAGHLTIRSFLTALRRGRQAEYADAREQRRQSLAALEGGLPKAIQLHHADCRRFQWPDGISVIVADPPWSDVSAYEWLSEWAYDVLLEGGLLLAYAGQYGFPETLSILTRRLTYVWQLVQVFGNGQLIRGDGRFRPCYRPILLLSKGQSRIQQTLSDTFTVRNDRNKAKTLHLWQQPIEPIRYFLSRLTTGNVLCADPFAGSGTCAIACLDLGLRYCGCEIDETTHKVARGRIRSAVRLASAAASIR